MGSQGFKNVASLGCPPGHILRTERLQHSDAGRMLAEAGRQGVLGADGLQEVLEASESGATAAAAKRGARPVRGGMLTARRVLAPDADQGASMRLVTCVATPGALQSGR